MTGGYDLTAHGDYTVAIHTALPSDAVNGNDTAVLVVSNAPNAVSYPMVENFETFLPGAPGVYNNGWSGDWWVEADSTSHVVKIARQSRFV